MEEQVLRLYTLTPAQQARFEAVQADVLQDLPGMRVIKDPQTGELAIWAKASQHEKLTDVFEQLKVKGESTDKWLLIGVLHQQWFGKTGVRDAAGVVPVGQILAGRKVGSDSGPCSVERAGTHQTDDFADGRGRTHRATRKNCDPTPPATPIRRRW